MLVVVLGFVLPVSAVISSDNAQDAEFLRIRIDSEQQLSALESRGVDVIADYGNGYVLVKVREGEGSYYGRYLEVENLDYSKMIDLTPSGISFDPSSERPSIPDSLRSRQTTDEYIIKFAGPIMKDWMTEIENMGGDFNLYFRFNSLLVKMPPS
ncbi:MAG: hypothetical protein KAI64_05075, partial [Thermoplasmata archaeon]|nr:hypothetical protein [Thermoplasmata archaeon]